MKSGQIRIKSAAAEHQLLRYVTDDALLGK